MSRPPIRSWMRPAGLALAAAVMLAQGAAAGEADCPLARQKPMLVAQLFFGQTIREGRLVSRLEWGAFLRQVVTPRFPDGFTVLEGSGQWMDPRTHAISHEATKMLVIATEDVPDVGTRIGELADIYRARFHQQSVGIVTQAGCGGF